MSSRKSRKHGAGEELDPHSVRVVSFVQRSEEGRIEIQAEMLLLSNQSAFVANLK